MESEGWRVRVRGEGWRVRGGGWGDYQIPANSLFDIRVITETAIGNIH